MDFIFREVAVFFIQKPKSVKKGESGSLLAKAFTYVIIVKKKKLIKPVRDTVNYLINGV